MQRLLVVHFHLLDGETLLHQLHKGRHHKLESVAFVDQNELINSQKLIAISLHEKHCLAQLPISIENLSVTRYIKGLILMTNLAKIYRNNLLTLQMTEAV